MVVREIFDCVEKLAINLSNDGIAFCMGDGFVLEEITEFRRVEQQPKKSSGEGKREFRSAENGRNNAV